MFQDFVFINLLFTLLLDLLEYTMAVKFFVITFYIYINIYIYIYIYIYISPQTSHWQPAIAERFAKANSVFIVITLAKILQR